MKLILQLLLIFSFFSCDLTDYDPDYSKNPSSGLSEVNTYTARLLADTVTQHTLQLATKILQSKSDNINENDFTYSATDYSFFEIETGYILQYNSYNGSDIFPHFEQFEVLGGSLTRLENILILNNIRIVLKYNSDNYDPDSERNLENYRDFLVYTIDGELFFDQFTEQLSGTFTVNKTSYQM